MKKVGNGKNKSIIKEQISSPTIFKGETNNWFMKLVMALVLKSFYVL